MSSIRFRAFKSLMFNPAIFGIPGPSWALIRGMAAATAATAVGKRILEDEWV
jgi:hypothetical protein